MRIITFLILGISTVSVCFAQVGASNTGSTGSGSSSGNGSNMDTKTNVVSVVKGKNSPNCTPGTKEWNGFNGVYVNNKTTSSTF